jgi:hypothetical protein
MAPRPIEEYAQAKNLGTLEQSYRESCTLSRAWGYTLLCGIFIVIWGVALLSVPFNQLLKSWPLLLFSAIWFCICFSIIVSSWRSYLNPEWIYLYNHGFIYSERDYIQTHHWSELLSIDLRYSISLNGKNQSVFRSYQVNFADGKTLSIVKGAHLKSHFERYQHLLRKSQ